MSKHAEVLCVSHRTASQMWKSTVNRKVFAAASHFLHQRIHSSMHPTPHFNFLALARAISGH